MSLLFSGCYNSGEPREKVLKIYNWADYIGDGVLEDFQAYYKEQTGEVRQRVPGETGSYLVHLRPGAALFHL